MGYYRDKKEQINTFPETVRELETAYNKFKNGDDKRKSKLFANLNGRVGSLKIFIRDFSSYLDKIQGEIGVYSGSSSAPASERKRVGNTFLWEVIINEATKGVWKKRKYFEVTVNHIAREVENAQTYEFETIEEVFSSLVNGDESYLLKNYYSPTVESGDVIEFRFYFQKGGILKSLGSKEMLKITQALSGQITKQPSQIRISYNTHMGRILKGLSTFSVIMVK